MIYHNQSYSQLQLTREQLEAAEKNVSIEGGGLDHVDGNVITRDLLFKSAYDHNERNLSSGSTTQLQLQRVI